MELIQFTENTGALVNRVVYSVVEKTCVKLIKHAIGNKGYDSFTGNTVTSYACGIYYNGDLMGIILAADGMKKPVAKKIKKGKRLFLKRPYEGKSRAVKGTVKVDDFYGAESSEKFLESYRPIIKNGYAIVMTTGTEYSEYLENVRELNVLSDTQKDSIDILLSSITPLE